MGGEQQMKELTFTRTPETKCSALFSSIAVQITAYVSYAISQSPTYVLIPIQVILCSTPIHCATCQKKKWHAHGSEMEEVMQFPFAGGVHNGIRPAFKIT